jgi:hypothetical protein
MLRLTGWRSRRCAGGLCRDVACNVSLAAFQMMARETLRATSLRMDFPRSYTSSALSV